MAPDPGRWRLAGAHAPGIASGDGEVGQSPDADFEYHAAVAIDGEPPTTSALAPLEIAAGRYAQHRLVGPYTQITAAITALFTVWMPQSGFDPDDRPMLEIYHSPFDTPPQDLQTDLLIPIRDLT